MADIVFKYPEMKAAADAIRNIASQYQTTADSFVSDFIDAIRPWEGDSKTEMVAFINGPVSDYIKSTIPSLVNALASLLEANAQQMKSADEQIAQSIPKSLTNQ